MDIETERLILRDLREEDEFFIVKYANNLNVSQYTERLRYPYTVESAKSIILSSLEQQNISPREKYELAITLKPENNLIGVVSLKKVDMFSGTAFLGYWLAENYWHKGIMSEAVSRILEFGFNEIGLRRINATVAIVNNASNKLLTKMGFVHEGVERQGHKVRSTGKIYDINHYGLLKEEFLKWKKN